MNKREYDNRVYAGVLGKLIGVFFGRPIEGWQYDRIRNKLGNIDRYVHSEVGTPLIVADDDLAGTFTFFNTIEDCANLDCLTGADFGETWLNYVIENKTIFWWGGLGRSTEHTAYLRLCHGIPAPHSGSAELNGHDVAEQIGAQIFIDAFALLCPNDPERARNFIRMAAQVSHDGLAVESACFIGVLESLAFSESKIDRLLDSALQYVVSDQLNNIVDDVRRKCAQENDWRKVRDWLDECYGYHLYPGNCHVVPNLALILVALILGGDSFYKSMEIVVSSGWDTDCNAANLGCINGVRLGLDAIDAEYAFRQPIADRFYCISSDGGHCVTDAVLQTRRIIAAHNRLYQLPQCPPQKRFGFEFAGSLQGFCACPVLGYAPVEICNGNTCGHHDGVLLGRDTGSFAVSTPVMWTPKDYQGNYCLIGSPTLYSGQTIIAELEALSGTASCRLYVTYYDFNDQLHVHYSMSKTVDADCIWEWTIPEIGGMTLDRLGIESNGTAPYLLLLRSIHWQGAPKKFAITGSLRNYDLPGMNMQMNSMTSSAKQFSFDSRKTFTVSHPELNGVVTTGTADWDNYRIASRVTTALNERMGLICRARGHRKYYAGLLCGYKHLCIIKKNGGIETVLTMVDFCYSNDQTFDMQLVCNGNQLQLWMDGKLMLQVSDDDYSCGAGGYIVDCGTFLADGFEVSAVCELPKEAVEL